MKKTEISPEASPTKNGVYKNAPSGGKRFVRAFFSIALALLLLWLVYRKIDLSLLWESLKKGSIRWGIIGFSIVIEALANTLRGLRWRLQMLPLAPPVPRRIVVIASMWGCYAVNLVLPRMGELWRCYLVSHKEHMSFSAVVGTLVSDRLVDVVMMGVLFLIALGGFGDEVTHLLVGAGIKQSLYHFFTSPWLYGALLAVAGLFILFRKKVKQGAWGAKIESFGKKFVSGFRTIRNMPHKGLFTILTLLIYTLYFIAFYCTFYAFPFTADLGIGVGLLAFIMATLGVALPVQGGIGPWHFMCITTLLAFGVSKNDAGLFAIVVHTAQTLGIAFLGLLAILFVPLLSRNRNNFTNK